MSFVAGKTFFTSQLISILEPITHLFGPENQVFFLPQEGTFFAKSNYRTLLANECRNRGECEPIKQLLHSLFSGCTSVEKSQNPFLSPSSSLCCAKCISFKKRSRITEAMKVSFSFLIFCLDFPRDPHCYFYPEWKNVEHSPNPDLKEPLWILHCLRHIKWPPLKA